MWSKLEFGKHRGKTLPQVLFKDPDWFFWACKYDAFKNWPDLKREAQKLYFQDQGGYMAKKLCGRFYEQEGKFFCENFIVIPIEEVRKEHDNLATLNVQEPCVPTIPNVY